MPKWLRRVRGALAMGMTWAVGWAVAGLLIGVASLLFPGPLWDRVFQVFDAPLPALAIPGFVAGTIFSTVLGVAGRRRRFDELSLPRFATWGAFGGFCLSLVPTVMTTVGLATGARPNLELWRLIVGPMVFLSAVSATATLLFARRAQERGGGDGSSSLSNPEVRSPHSLPAGPSERVPVPARETVRVEHRD